MITNGGLVPGGILSEALGITHVLTASVYFPDEVDQKLAWPTFIQFPSDTLLSNRRILIVDDICDGGATFVGLAKELRAAGAKKVYLYVTHGIFSKGLPLEGIDKVFTTDSYFNPESCSRPGTVPYCFDDARRDGHLSVIPVSMKDLK